ncbi:light-sensor protein kinase-like protein [Tanacetum coccineum]|uniref:Light-sensor protein kinase-like protein n=1 Tax=Tanacetum coccineum TaxID=301880 RepID=A0ABQ4WSB1_9ASTR
MNKRETQGNDTVYYALFNGSSSVFVLPMTGCSLELEVVRNYLEQNMVSQKHILPYHWQHRYDQRKYHLLFDKYDKTLSSYIWADVGLKKKIRIIRQVVIGLQSLHRQKIWHGDLSPRNIVASRGRIKLKGITCIGEILKDMKILRRLVLYIAFGGRYAFNHITSLRAGEICNDVSGDSHATPILCDLVSEIPNGA